MFNSEYIHTIMKNCDNISPEDKIILSSIIGHVVRRAKNIDIHELHAIPEYTQDSMWVYIIVQQQGKTSIIHRIGIEYSDLKNIDKCIINHLEMTAKVLGISFNELRYTTADSLKRK